MSASFRETEIAVLHQAIHVIHRANFAYWRAEERSREATAEYHWRQERLDAIRITLFTAQRDENHSESMLRVPKCDTGSRRDVHSMGKPPDGGHESVCLLAHDLVNKVSIILGYCDLLIEEPAGPKTAARLRMIHDTA